MKPTLVGLFLSFFSFILYAQDSTQVSPPPQSAVVAASPAGPVLSATPSAQEIADLFLSVGRRFDSKVAVRIVSRRGDGAIPGLQGLLFSEKVHGSQTMSADTGGGTVDFPQPRFYAISALEDIGSDSAISVLVQAVITHRMPEVRAFALNAVANTFYEKARNEGIVPSRNILEALFHSIDDPTYDGALQMAIKQVAYGGLMRWLGLDFGDPQFKEARIKAGGGQREMSPELYRQLWWKENRDKLVWNKNTGHFEVAVQ